jgi:hypothetical protein
VRDGYLKRIWKHDGDNQESWLFDLRTDPAEQVDLIAENAADAARLTALLAEWERDVAPRR